MQGTLSAAERSMRSVFVGNIPYEATEEQLKDIFSEVGPVVSFRLVYDRETGKPKGYGFCEYKDQEMALSAMRNLNGYELNGRALRVDNAASEKSKEELKNLQASLGGPPVESPYGPEVQPDKAPEAVSKVVASLPPEQMYELMKEMKMCIQNNPNEARNLLLQNPQLAYALLQGQVVMRIIDPTIAMRMLHRQNPNAAVALLPTPESESAQSAASPASKISNTPAMPTSLPYHQPAVPMISDVPNNPTFSSVNSTAPGSSQPVSNLVMSTGTRSAIIPPPRPSLLGDHPQPGGPVEATRPTAPPIPPGNQYSDRESFEPYGEHRSHSDLDMRQVPRPDHDMRQAPVRQPSSMLNDQDMRQSMADQDLRMMAPNQGMIDNRPFDPRFRPISTSDPSGRPGMIAAPYDRQRSTSFDPRSAYDNRHTGAPGPMQLEDPRNTQVGMGAPSRMPVGTRMTTASASPVVPQSSPIAGSSPRPSSSLAAAAAAIAPHDQEKAALIMQVLQLSDQQIAMLPPEQRQSIMILKEQIARSGPH